MKAYLIHHYQKQPALFTDVNEPTVGERDVLIQVHAAGLNHLDMRVKSGEFKLLLPYQFPLILGHDVAGVVIKTGSQVRAFKVGDAVFARPQDGRIGTFAEQIAICEDDVAKKPNNLSMVDAAGLPLVALTAWQALVEIAKVHAGQKVFIHAGAGGVGSVAIQLAKALGAFVATTTSQANIDFVKSLGADVVVDYKQQNFQEILQGYDVVLNSLDEQTLLQSIQVMNTGGKLISISGPPDEAYARQAGLNIAFRYIMRLLSWKVRRAASKKQIDYHFLFMRANGQQLQKIADLVEQGKIQAHTQSVYDFAEINQAFDELSQGRTRGKIVVKMRD